MGVRFNAEEILRIAVQIEVNGEMFYQEAARRFPSSPARGALQRLAEMERLHTATFRKMIESLSLDPLETLAFDPNDESGLYLQAIADGKVFPLRSAREEIESMPGSLEAILEEVLGREKDSVLFYISLVDIIPNELGRAEVYAIIKEEMSHVRLIIDLLSAQ